MPANTVAICTYNRAEKLRDALAAIRHALTQARSGEWEVLVVDNNSSDHTADVCEEAKAGLPLRYVFEEEQGLSHARNRAVRECRGELLLFTDDDVTVGKYWLREYDNARGLFPGADFFGGRVKPRWETPRPRWLHDEKMALLSGLLVHYDRGPENRMLEDGDPLPYGASFAITRTLFEQVGRFRPDLGVMGEVPGRGEEADYMTRAQKQGFHGAYIASAISYHPVDHARLSLRYLYCYGVQKGVAETRLSHGTTKDIINHELRYGIRALVQLARGRGDRFRQCIINMGIQRGLRRASR